MIMATLSYLWAAWEEVLVHHAFAVILVEPQVPPPPFLNILQQQSHLARPGVPACFQEHVGLRQLVRMADGRKRVAKYSIDL